MAEKIAFKNDRISNFKELVTLTFALDQIILYVCMYGYLRPALLGRLCQRVDPKIGKWL